MLVDDVRADGDMDGDRDAALDARAQDAQLALREIAHRLAEGLPGAEAAGGAVGERGVHEARGFIDHAERSVVESALDVLARLALIGGLEVVDGAGAVERDCGKDAAPHGIDDHGIEPALDRMGAHHEDDRAAIAHRVADGGDDFPQVVRCQEVRQLFKKRAERAAPLSDPGEVADGNFARTLGKRVGLDFAEIQRLEIHDRGYTAEETPDCE